jgi:1,4-alpha-glucan branching enzyme
MAGRTGTPKSKTKVVKPATKVLFELSAPEANQVYLAGDFNNWDTAGFPMKKDKKGIWKATASLKPGRYEYRFLVDGDWKNDPCCPGCVPNEFGSQNCVRIVE